MVRYYLWSCEVVVVVVVVVLGDVMLLVLVRLAQSVVHKERRCILG